MVDFGCYNSSVVFSAGFGGDVVGGATASSVAHAATVHAVSAAAKFSWHDVAIPPPCCACVVQGTLVLDAEENVLELEGETVVVGDLHGQFFDLVNLLGTHGKVRRCPRRCLRFCGLRGQRCCTAVASSDRFVSTGMH